MYQKRSLHRNRATQNDPQVSISISLVTWKLQQKDPFKEKNHLNQTCILGFSGVSDVERLLGAGSAQGCLTGCNLCFILLLLVLWCFCFNGKLCVWIGFVFLFAHPPGGCIHDIWMFVLIIVLCFHYSCNVRPVMFFQVAESPATPNPCRQWKILPLALPNCTGASGCILDRNWVVTPTWNPKKPIFGGF